MLVVSSLAAGLLIGTPANAGYRASVSMGLYDLKPDTKLLSLVLGCLGCFKL